MKKSVFLAILLGYMIPAMAQIVWKAGRASTLQRSHACCYLSNLRFSPAALPQQHEAALAVMGVYFFLT